MIRVLICDGDGTLGFPNPSDEIKALLVTLNDLNITLAVASNQSRSTIVSNFRRAGLPAPNPIVTPAETGEQKGSPLFVDMIKDAIGVESTEIVYLGDDDRTDMFCAINSGILPLNALYSVNNKQRRYGLSISTPEDLARFLKTFGQQPEPYFGWTYQNAAQSVDARTLLDQHGWEPDIARVLKDEFYGDANRKSEIQRVLGLGIVSSCYQSGLMQEVDWITVYPSHQTGTQNQLVRTYSLQLSQLFRDKFKDDLLIRHTTAPQSRREANRKIESQLNSIQVNPLHMANLQGKRVLVLDDFTTIGYSLETARQMLIGAGCASVACVAVGKFRNGYSVSRLRKRLDPYSPSIWQPEDINLFEFSGRTSAVSDQYFREEIWPEYVS